MMVKTKNINIKVWVGGKINRPGQVTPPPILLPISFYFSDTENKFIGSVCYFNSIFNILLYADALYRKYSYNWVGGKITCPGQVTPHKFPLLPL